MAHTIDYATILLSKDYDYCIDALFDGGTLQTLSMRHFIESSDNPLIRQYLDKEKFRNDFSFDKYGLYWGNDMSVSANWAFEQSILPQPNIKNTDHVR